MALTLQIGIKIPSLFSQLGVRLTPTTMMLILSCNGAEPEELLPMSELILKFVGAPILFYLMMEI